MAPARGRLLIDATWVVVVTAVALAARRNGLPVDGVWFDDSWVAAGAVLGTPRSLLVVGSSHPGFTAVLMGIDRLGGGLREMGIPSLVAGVAGPAGLYLALCRLGYARALGMVASAVLVVATIPVLYAGRIKGYTLDIVVVLAMAAMLPTVVRRTWGPRFAVAWVVGAVVVGTLSGYTLVASALAGVVAVLHPRRDLVARIVAVGVQGSVQLAYVTVVRSKTDLDGVEEVMETRYDGHLDLSWNPWTLATEVGKHLRRVAEVYPAGPTALLTLLGVLAIAGLVLGALGRRHDEAIACRFALALVTVAFVGASLSRFPFGPSNENPLSAGGRHTLWLVPALAIGLVVVGDRIRTLVRRADPTRRVVDAVLVIGAVAVLVVGYQPGPSAPFPGSASAARHIEAERSEGDVVIVAMTSTFNFALHTASEVALRATPDHQVGFAPDYRDPSIHNVGGWAARPSGPSDIRAWVAETDRVFVLGDGALRLPSMDRVGAVLREQGFERTRLTFDVSSVDVWER